MKNLKRLALTAVAAIGMGLLASTPSWAIHKGAGGLVCGGCHTMHNSQGRASLIDGSANSDGAGGGSLILLRGAVSARANIHNLCLQCHAANGSRATDTHAPHNYTAPKVLLGGASSPWNQDTSFNRVGAGGDFNDECGGGTGSGITTWSCTGSAAGLGKGHSLGATTVTPPGSADGALDYLTCTNCHDPHGVESGFTTSAIANTYRMLRKEPTGSGGGVSPDSQAPFAIASTSSYIGGISGLSGSGGNYNPIDSANGNPGGSGATAIWPMFQGAMTGTFATDSPNGNYYSSDIANWCAACHDNWHEANDGTNNAGGMGAQGDWKRHPVNNIIVEAGAAGLSGASVKIIDETFPNYDETLAGQAVPVVSGSAANKTWYLQDGTADRVFCLSCHFPHGSPYYDLLRWNYTSAVSAGAQDGNAVPVTRGCQLCHNRGGL